MGVSPSLSRAVGSPVYSLFHPVANVLIMLSLCTMMFLSGCSVQTLRRTLTLPEKANSLDKDSEYLKAHMRNGDVYILTQWIVNSVGNSVSGNGVRLGPDRRPLADGTFVIPLDSVAIFETNRPQSSDAVSVLSLVTTFSAALTVYCIANPKACFGSCPTFYASDGERELLQAEGFSSSVAPSLEATDIDALYRARAGSNRFVVCMTNEALETHVVRYVDLLAAPRPTGGRVFVTAEGTFWQTSEIVSLQAGEDQRGSCLDELRQFDGWERVSKTDSFDLAAKETIDLRFDIASSSPLGLVIACRQSLLSTYLYYQTLAYMGSAVGDWITRLETGNGFSRASAGGVGRALGGIDVLVQTASDEWTAVGTIKETGPLATDVHLLLLACTTSAAKHIRLRLTRGAWRLDWVALAVMSGEVEPVRVKPSQVWTGSAEQDNRREIPRDRVKPLITLPGDSYIFIYDLPHDYENLELFLESRGYYLEWMRQEWLREEDQTLAAMMFLNPEESLRRLAPQYKGIEDSIETVFWNSRYAR